MTKCNILGILLLLVLNSTANAADVEVLNKFDSNPKLKSTSNAPNDKQVQITSRLDLKECKNRDFKAELDIQIL